MQTVLCREQTLQCSAMEGNGNIGTLHCISVVVQLLCVGRDGVAARVFQSPSEGCTGFDPSMSAVFEQHASNEPQINIQTKSLLVVLDKKDQNSSAMATLHHFSPTYFRTLHLFLYLVLYILYATCYMLYIQSIEKRQDIVVDDTRREDTGSD